MKILVTGCGGLIGSAVCELALSKGWYVTGIDGDFRGLWFGKAGSVEWRLRELVNRGVRVIRDDFRNKLDQVKGQDVVVHCASQPSHDFSRSHVVQDSAINYMGTVQLLESCRTRCPEASFVFLSTNKVYGDRVNQEEYNKAGERFVPVSDIAFNGIDESYPMDESLHTPFGVSKTAADLMVQEYRRCFGMKTVTLRCGCLTGKSGSPVEMQGFLGYLVKRAVAGESYTIYGHGGYQVRDNLDCDDLAEAILLCAKDPKQGVYNMGGGKSNSVSVLEAIRILKTEHKCWFPVNVGPERLGDHKFWISDCRRFERDYPEWQRKKTVEESIREMVQCELSRRGSAKGNSTLPSRAIQETGLQ